MNYGFLGIFDRHDDAGAAGGLLAFAKAATLAGERGFHAGTTIENHGSLGRSRRWRRP